MIATELLDQVQRSLGTSYTLLRELGGGGMSRVFLAEETALGRMVVLKVMSPHLAQGLSVDRFTREIRLAARLQHPHIVPLFSAGEVDGLPWYTMPYIDGESLRARLSRQGELPVGEAVAVLRDIARALEYAHAHDVVHRDIKPENVLLSGNSACVADFGIAKAVNAARTSVEPGGANDASLTGTGLSIGTPAYMAPEQAAGLGDVDHRADLYSFGCIAYELLSGRPPFSNRSVQAMMMAHMTEKPSLARLRRAEIPRTLSDLVICCLAKEPNERPSSALAVLTAMDSGAARVTPSSGALSPEPAASIAVLPFESMSADKDNEYFADGITEEIINALTQLPTLRVAGRTSSFSFKGTKHDLPTIAEKLNVTTILEGSVRRSVNRLRITAQLVNASDGYHLWSARYDRELTDVFAVQDEIAKAIASRLRLSLGRRGEGVKPPTVSIEAYELFIKGRVLTYKLGHDIFEGIKCFQGAVALDERFGLAHAGLADALTLSAYIGLVRPGDVIDRAHAAAKRAVELAPDSADCHHALALWMTLYGGDRDAAFAEWERAISVGVQSTEVRCSYAIWGLGLLAQRWDDAVKAAEAAVVADPLSGYANSIVALTKIFARQSDGLLESALRGVELEGPLFWGHWSLQRAYHHVGMHDAALRQAAVTLGASGRHPWALSELAVEHATVGDYEAADAIFSEMSARSRHELVSPAPLALAAICARRMDEAIALCHRAIDERDVYIQWSVVDRWDGWGPLYAHSGWPAVKKRILAW